MSLKDATILHLTKQLIISNSNESYHNKNLAKEDVNIAM